MNDIALSIQNLNIIYTSYHSMRIRNIFSHQNRKLKAIQAIKDLSFTVNKGEVIGIVGRNGSGKTTLLRSIAGIFSPDSGLIEMYGNRVSLMALGVGFDPELTGKENVILSGMMLGFSRTEISERMDEIIEFSELGDFIDFPVRTYSSGMYSKLAFSITSVLQADIILIDEVLSVGDIAFQAKSKRKMKELIGTKEHTVLIVSHDLGMLESLCDKVLWLDGGRFKSFGETKAVLKEYRKYMYIPEKPEKQTDTGIYLFDPDEELWNRIKEAVPEVKNHIDGILNEKTLNDFIRCTDKKLIVFGDINENKKIISARFEPEQIGIVHIRDW